MDTALISKMAKSADDTKLGIRSGFPETGPRQNRGMVENIGNAISTPTDAQPCTSVERKDLQTTLPWVARSKAPTLKKTSEHQ